MSTGQRWRKGLDPGALKKQLNTVFRRSIKVNMTMWVQLHLGQLNPRSFLVAVLPRWLSGRYLFQA
jgi:hypothetical protein